MAGDSEKLGGNYLPPVTHTHPLMPEETLRTELSGKEFHRWQVHTLMFAYEIVGRLDEGSHTRCQNEAANIAKSVLRSHEETQEKVTAEQLREVARYTLLRAATITGAVKPGKPTHETDSRGL